MRVPSTLAAVSGQSGLGLDSSIGDQDNSEFSCQIFTKWHFFTDR